MTEEKPIGETLQQIAEALGGQLGTPEADDLLKDIRTGVNDVKTKLGDIETVLKDIKEILSAP